MNGHFGDVVHHLFFLVNFQPVLVDFLLRTFQRHAVRVQLYVAFFIEHFFVNRLAVFVRFVFGDEFAVLIPHIIDGFETDRALYDLSRRTLQQAHDRHGGNGFTATGFAHHAHRGIEGDIEADAVYGFHNALIGKEIRMKILYFQNIGGIFQLGSVGRRRYLAFFLLFQPAHFLLVGFGDFADFFARKIMRARRALVRLFAVGAVVVFLFE